MMLERIPMRLTVPWLDRPLEREDQTGDEVVDHVLEAEANAYAEGAGQQRQPADLEPRRRRGEQESDQENCPVDHRGDRVGRPGVPGLREDVLGEQGSDDAGDDDREPDGDQESEDAPDGDRDRSDIEARRQPRRQRIDERVGDAEERGDQQDPGGEGDQSEQKQPPPLRRRRVHLDRLQVRGQLRSEDRAPGSLEDQVAGEEDDRSVRGGQRGV
jgi:competence protein ComGC